MSFKQHVVIESSSGADAPAARSRSHTRHIEIHFIGPERATRLQNVHAKRMDSSARPGCAAYLATRQLRQALQL